MFYVKLVRDKVPTLLMKKGKRISTLALQPTDAAYLGFLLLKLQEEVDEFMREGDIDELADVVDVVETIQRLPQYSRDKVQEIQQKKKEEKGGFDKGFILMNLH